MLKFYCIVSDITNLANPDTFSLLQEAARKQGYEFIPVDAATIAPSSLQIEHGAILYRLGVSSQAKFLEGYLCHEGVATFYVNYPNLLGRSFTWGSTLRLEKAGLPSISTVFSPWLLSDSDLRQAVTELGGLPIVVKAAGGSHGSAVKKADTFGELKEMFTDEAIRDGAVLRKFIHGARHIRVVVVGEVVCDAVEYDTQPDDFRTNAVAMPTVKVFDVDSHPALCRVAVEAVRVLGLEFGGVDILLQPDGKFSIAEVNFPCNFARNQLNTGVDIAEAMVKYLAAKSGSLLDASL